MHDMSLGGPVDVGGYTGYILNGKPIHIGNCEDGVYGCRKCNRATRQLSVEDRIALGIESNQDCDYCHKSVDISKIHGLRPWDEPSCYYEVCLDCYGRHDKELAEMESDDISSRRW